MDTHSPRIVGVAEEDPLHPATWSGSSAYCFSALRASGHLAGAISAEPSRWTAGLYKARNIDTDLQKWKFKYSLDVGFYNRMADTARRRLKSIHPSTYDAILQIGALVDLTNIPGKFTISYHDGNLAALLASPHAYPDIGQARIKAALQYERALYSRLNHIFTMSEWLADSFVKDFGVSRSKLTPIGAGINLPYIREVSDKSYESPDILFVGKMFERKGGKYLLEAFQQVRREIPQATLTLIGPDLSNLPTGVRCLNYVSKQSPTGLELLLNEYAKAAVFVLPSLYEPFGISLAEAMAHKLPCVGTQICAMPEIVQHQVNGLLVPPGDAKSLGNALLNLLKEPRQCKEFGESAYHRYLEKFTWNSVESRLISRLTHLI